MNKYGSNYTILTVRGISQSVIAPPGDYLWPFDRTNRRQAWAIVPNINPNSNIILRAVTVSCNFADGLVWKNPGSRMQLSVGCSQLIIGDIPLGTVSAPSGSRVITGLGTAFLSNLVVNQDIVILGKLYKIISIPSEVSLTVDRPVIHAFAGSAFIRKTPPYLTFASYSGSSKTVTVYDSSNIHPTYFYKSGGTDNEFFYVDSVGTGTFTALNYPRGFASFSEIYPVYRSPAFSQTGKFDITRLNTPVEANTFLTPVNHGTEGADAIALQMYLGANFDTPSFMTRSISNLFEGAGCIFDVDVDLEYTA
jgi:hypothetical protein